MRMPSVSQIFAAALAHHRADRPAEAEALYREILERLPDHPDTLHLLGVVVFQQGRPLEALELITHAVELEPDKTEFLYNLGEVLRSLGRRDDALAYCQRILELEPERADGYALQGMLLQELDRLDEAAVSYRQALALSPDDPGLHNNLGIVFQDAGELAEAEHCFRQALELDPDHINARTNLGNTLKEQGRVAEAVACYQALLEAWPEMDFVRSNLLFTGLALPGPGLPEIDAAARRWDELHGGPVSVFPAPTGPARLPRLGFVSGDFRRHAVGYLTIAVLEALARAGHAFACYSNNLTDDALTERFRAAATWWRPVLGLSDDAVAAQIRADGIDILFDLSGHTAQNRLRVFARKPAPLQITWAGYGATTGLAAMDYWLADARQIPPEAEPWYREKIIRMPASYIAWEPPAPDEAPPVGPLPAETNGYITFGSFNFLSKLSPEVVAVWSRILMRVPDARLLLKAGSFNCATVRERYRALFAGHGIGADRLEFAGGTSRAEHLAITGRTDIALDSFPYNGGLTTLETLWMGVPVITLPGATLCSRHSFGYLHTLGLTDHVAADSEHYVELAVALAAEQDRLAALRAGLRDRMRASPLCDADGFARELLATCGCLFAQYSTRTVQAGGAMGQGVGKTHSADL